MGIELEGKRSRGRKSRVEDNRVPKQYFGEDRMCRNWGFHKRVEQFLVGMRPQRDIMGQ